MHRCPVVPAADELPLYGRELAGPVAVAGGSGVAAAFVAAATGLVQVGPHGVPGVLATAVAALLLVVVALRPARSSCSVRRAVLGAVIKVAAAAVTWLAVTPV